METDLERCGRSWFFLALLTSAGMVTYGAYAVVKVTGLKHRVAGLPDALIVVDRHPWDETLDRDEQLALLDHELEHLAVKATKGGDVRVDDQTGAIHGAVDYDAHDRPRLRCRNHDWQLGGFRSIAQRWRGKAIEVQAVRACQDESGQFMWEFAKR